MSQQNNQQVKNDRINQVLKMLKEGLPRDKIADQFGYSTWKSLDIYMRRHGFTWDSQGQLYTLALPETPPKEELTLPSIEINPEDVVKLFSIGILDSREIAKRTGFSGHKEMATYMLRHGYIWSAAALNYINPNPTTSKGDLEDSVENLRETRDVQTDNFAMGNGTLAIEKYKTLLEFLWKSRDQLIKIIESMNTENKIRVYTVPGKAKTKSIFLSDGLSELMLTLCQKHSLSQRQGYEAALVEYLTKYGYQDNIEQLLNTRDKLETPRVPS
ncbi:MAG: hypothetical protein APF81_01985 [Desulfosporosinus sp. BRH_c37]|nr:MAG: hypothetical protein APF81_01985 [Desulfosporosinus sp. BRH_c37]